MPDGGATVLKNGEGILHLENTGVKGLELSKRIYSRDSKVHAYTLFTPGTLVNIPVASNMREVTWDNELADLAEIWTSQCTMEKLVLSGGQIVETDFFDLYRSGK